MTHKAFTAAGGITDVFLITGFLGSGKTTFLNRLTAAFPPDLKIMILMNEFGDVGIDGLLVEGEDLDILEISRGSIFCVCVKTDFIKGLMKIAEAIRPDVLIIEATGTADPSDMKRDLALSVFHNRFRFREQICLIDACNFAAVHDTFVSVEKQMVAATCFIINKTDLATPAEIRHIREMIGRFHPDPGDGENIFETTFGEIPLERITRHLPAAKAAEPVQETISPETAAADAADIDALLKDPLRVMLPPDSLASAVYQVNDAAAETFDTFIRLLPAGLLRAKGFVNIDGTVRLFSWVMGKTELRQPGFRKIPAAVTGRIVFIGPPDALRDLAAVCRKHPLVA